MLDNNSSISLFEHVPTTNIMVLYNIIELASIMIRTKDNWWNPSCSVFD